MEDENDTFDQGQFLGKKGVEQHTHYGDRNHDESAMKGLGDVGLMIECKQADEHICENVTASGDTRVPAQNTYPATNITEESLDAFRRKFGDPMVLAARCWCPAFSEACSCLSEGQAYIDDISAIERMTVPNPKTAPIYVQIIPAGPPLMSP